MLTPEIVSQRGLVTEFRVVYREREDLRTEKYFSVYAHSMDISYSGDLIFKDKLGIIIRSLNRSLWKDVEEVIG